MAQRPSSALAPAGLHVGIIMDGNGRWAVQQGLPRGTGHQAGADAVRRIAETAPGVGVGILSLFAFSSDNWRRPAVEVAWLMRLFREYIRTETARCVANGVRLEVIGRRDRLGLSLLRAIEAAEVATSGGTRLRLRVAIDYSGRDAILRAAQCLKEGAVSRESFARLVAIADHGSPVPELDLLIRTGGERRLSDFLLWEAAYAELYFTDLMWPEFGPDALRSAIQDFASRERRFGGLTPEAVEA
jgi:undecaprenyl diphosphate synthase